MFEIVNEVSRECTAVVTVKEKKLAVVQSYSSQWRSEVQWQQPALIGFPSCTQLLPPALGDLSSRLWCFRMTFLWGLRTARSGVEITGS